MTKLNTINVLILSIIFLSACNNTIDLKDKIHGNGIKYWDYNMVGRGQNVWFTFSFDKLGFVKKYSFYKNKRWLFEDYPGPTSEIWTVSNDSILTFLESNYKIVNISDNIMELEELKTNKRHLLYKAKGKLNIQVSNKLPFKSVL